MTLHNKQKEFDRVICISKNEYKKLLDKNRLKI